jgi:Arc/MetJ family transcription regulator
MTVPLAEAATVARKCWRTLEPYHAMIYFVPEAAQRYEDVGVSARSGYFGSRSAPMGAVGPVVVQATFFNFHPELVHRAMDGLWDEVTPGAMLDARHDAVDAALRRLLGDEIDSPQVTEALEILRPAVDAARERPEGRPLFAGHAQLPEPEPPHVALWHAITLLREFRGDGHVATLLDAGFRGVEGLILHGASGDVPLPVLQQTRAWPDDEWDAAVEAMHERLLVEGESLTTVGTELRARIEGRTDELAAAAWRAIDVSAAERLREIVRPWSRSISATGFGFTD